MEAAISVVGCCYNRAENVRKWLESLAQQTCANITEVVLVDYGSTDGLDKVLKESPLRVSVYTVTRRGVDEPGFPEAFLKNVGIRRARGDVVLSTNVDVVYEPSFVEKITSRCGPGVLVQAVRKNAQRGVPVNIDATTVPPDSVKSMCNDFSLETGVPLVAGADCQAMTRQFWHMFQGYDEELFGWGALDSDLTCRAVLWGMTVIIVGHRAASYLHEWHDFSVERQVEAARRNHPIIMGKINSGTVLRNGASWGGFNNGSNGEARL